MKRIKRAINNFQRKEVGIKIILVTSASLSILAVFMIIAYIFRESLPAIRTVGFKGLFSFNWKPEPANPPAGSYGMLVPIIGTISATFWAILFGAPLAIGTAVYIDQMAPMAIRSVINRGIEILAGIPSVIIGWFGLTMLVPALRNVTATNGFGIMAAGVVLAVMSLPTITSISVDALRALPPELEEASLAMGATRWQTVSRALLPAARRGVLIAVILGIGRAVGETMAVQMVVGNANQVAWPWELFKPTSTLTSRIISDIGESTGVFRSVVYTEGLVLLIFAMVLILAIRMVSRERKR
ncbi:MAG: phosphate ABC transporter permease subunit PstC [Actinobacteria bacterium]|nr:phosphate ABC transporter permease subunit PstC [Actinomycetota bacterium]